MLNYTEKQLKSIIEEIINKEIIKLTPVGNHHLNRHLVYKIDIFNEPSLIFKLYYKKNKRNRELKSLKLLEKSIVKAPKVFAHGDFNNGDEWLITEFMEGQLLDNIKNQLSSETKLKLFRNIGEELGKMHSYKTFDFFGDWEKPYKDLDYCNIFIESTEDSIKDITRQELPDNHILMEAVEIIRNNYEIFKIDFLPRLTHNDFDGRNILVNSINGVYEVSSLIDFEICVPGNIENDLVSLYYKYFLEDKNLEESFVNGYTKFIPIDPGFHKRLKVHLLKFIISNCSWSYIQAPDYYKENIQFLRSFLRNYF